MTKLGVHLSKEAFKLLDVALLNLSVRKVYQNAHEYDAIIAQRYENVIILLRKFAAAPRCYGAATSFMLSTFAAFEGDVRTFLLHPR